MISQKRTISQNHGLQITAKISLLFCCVAFSPRVDAGSPSSSLQQRFQDFTRCQLFPAILPFFEREDTSVNYLLYTKSNPDDACDLQPTQEALKKCSFNPAIKTKVIVHGWISTLTPIDLKIRMKNEYLKAGDYNVVVFNWTSYTQLDSNPVGYLLSSALLGRVALRIATWVNFLQEKAGASPKAFHFLPHSLGSELVSFAAKMICQLGHITYMDPAGPGFRFLPSFLKPTNTDADFVEAIHTNGATNALQGNGLLFPLADIDYYPNGGSSQPKCYDGAQFQYSDGRTGTVDSSSTSNSCSHYAVYEYYLASYQKGCDFLGVICDSYENFKDNKCTVDNSAMCKMGFGTKKNPDLQPFSKCYFKTSDSYPYCLGKNGIA